MCEFNKSYLVLSGFGAELLVAPQQNIQDETV